MTPLRVLADTVLLLVCWEGLQTHGQQLGTAIITSIQRQSWVELKHNLLLVGWYSSLFLQFKSEFPPSNIINCNALPCYPQKNYNAVILCKASEENYNVVVTYFLMRNSGWKWRNQLHFYFQRSRTTHLLDTDYSITYSSTGFDLLPSPLTYADSLGSTPVFVHVKKACEEALEQICIVAHVA